MSPRLRVVVLAILVVSLLALAWLANQSSESAFSKVRYQDRSLENWFFAGRTNIWSAQARQNSQIALLHAGSNAVPFLVSKLLAPAGSPAFYAKLYSRCPAAIAGHFRCPLTDEQIRSVAWMDLYAIKHHLNEADCKVIGEALLRSKRPEVTVDLLGLLRERNPKVHRPIARKLLDDPDPYVRVHAAIPLAQDAIMQDPSEPRLAEILLPAFEDTPAIVAASISNQRQNTNPALAALSRRFHADPAESLHREIRIALIRLEPYLSAAQQARFEAADQLARARSPRQ